MELISLYEKYFKRLLDIIFSGGTLIILVPVLVVIAILVKIKLGSPVLFKQERPGKNEEIFKMYKFRSMTDQKDKKGNLLPDADRLPKFGKVLRSTSLDELPGLWNIFRGDMSIVGPRPLLVRYLPLYNEFQRQRHQVRPGLTGLAQVNGRNSISWDERFKLDVEYVKSVSFINDLNIILLTVKKVLEKEGVNQEGYETVKYFTGNEEE